MRYRQTVIVFRVLFVILILGLFYIQIIRGDYYHNLSRKNTIRVVSFEAARGKIIDRNGTVLADTIPSFNISVIPQEVKNKTNLFTSISTLLGIPLEVIQLNYNKNYLNPFIPVKICEKIDKDKIIILEENKLQLPGVIVDIQPQRFYPFGMTASHILGYLAQIDISRITKLKPYGYEFSDLVGYSGIEEYYDLTLRGEDGGEQIEVDNLGQKVRTVGYKPPKSGRDIQITIDARIQQIVENLMQNKIGAVVIMDPYNGEIITLSSSPGFNPNDFARKRKDIIKDLLINESSPLFNRAVSGRYPPGSVFKIVTAVAALEKDALSIKNHFTCKGSMRIGDRDFNCWSIHEDESLRDAVVHSCNVYFYNSGILTGPELIRKYAYLLGLGRRTGIDLNYEAKGFIPSPNWKKIMKFQSWYKGDTANMSIGQGEVLATPLQLTIMVSFFANGGELVQPHLIKAISNKELSMGRNKKTKINQGILRSMNEFLFSVVNDPDGTANVTEIRGLKIYGKTGTAQVQGKDAHGWFVGYVGKDKPRYAFCIFLENAGSSYAACLAAKEILTEMLSQDLI